MIKKIFWSVILLGTLYTAGAFYSPTLVAPLWDMIGLSGYNTFIKSFKGNLDQVSTDIPSQNEFLDTGKMAMSWALDIKDKVVWGISTTKDTIDTIRETASGAEATYKDVKNTFDQAKEVVEGTTEKIQQVKNTLDDVQKLSDGITSVVNTGNVDAVVEANNQ